MRTSSPVALLLAAWLGAAVLVAAVVAPAAFAVLPSRTLAGALVGRVLPTVFLAGLVIALLGIVLDNSAVGSGHGVRRAALVVLALSCAVAQFVVAPRIERVRGQIAGPVEDLSPADPRRVTFGRLHAISVAWLGLAMISAGVTVVLLSIAPKQNRSVMAAEPSVAESR